MDAAPTVPASPITVPAPEENVASIPSRPPAAPVQLDLAMPGFRLEAPMRLNPVVRDALADIVDAMNRDEPGNATRLEQAGLFIALSEFTQRQLEPSLVLRALADAGMLAQQDGGAATVACVIDGEQTQGLLLASRCIVNDRGLPPC